MSVEICVVSDSLLNSIAEWQRAIDAEGFALRLSSGGSFPGQGGTLIAHLRGKLTSFQYWVEDPSELISTYRNVNFGHDWKYAIAFPFIRDFAELTAVWMAAAAYARSTKGFIFDEQAGKLFSANESLEAIRDIERGIPEAEAILRDLPQQPSPKS